MLDAFLTMYCFKKNLKPKCAILYVGTFPYKVSPNKPHQMFPLLLPVIFLKCTYKPYNQIVAILFGQVFTLKLGNNCLITKCSLGQMVKEFSRLDLKHPNQMLTLSLVQEYILKWSPNSLWTNIVFTLNLNLFHKWAKNP